MIYSEQKEKHKLAAATQQLTTKKGEATPEAEQAVLAEEDRKKLEATFRQGRT